MKEKKMLLLIGLFACSFLFAQNSEVKNEIKPDMYSVKIFSNTDNSYGYEILDKGRVLIHQQNIPGQPGVKGFQNKNDAKKVASLVIKKLSQGIMPPTVEKKELIQLKIDF